MGRGSLQDPPMQNRIASRKRKIETTSQKNERPTVTPWTAPPERAMPPAPKLQEEQSRNNAPPPPCGGGGGGAMREDPTRTFPLQPHWNRRKLFFRRLWRHGLLGQAPPRLCKGGGGGMLAQGLGIRLFAFGGAYWPLATAHSDPLWVRTCFGCVNGAPKGGGGGRRRRRSFRRAAHVLCQRLAG